MYEKIKHKVLWTLVLGGGGTLLMLCGLALIIEDNPVVGGALLVPAGVEMAIAFMLILWVVFRALLTPASGDLALGLVGLVGGGILFSWNLDSLRNLSEHLMHPGDLEQMKVDETLFGFFAYFFLLVAILGVVLLVQRQKETETEGTERQSRADRMKAYREYWSTHKAERIFLMIWIGVFLLASVICLFVQPILAVAFAALWVVALFALNDGVKKWEAQQKLIATGTPVWATVTKRIEGKNFGEEVEAARVELEFVSENGERHLFRYESDSVKLSGLELAAKKVQVIVDPEDWGHYYVDWSNVRTSKK